MNPELIACESFINLMDDLEIAEEASVEYDRPYDYEQLVEEYGKDKADKLLADPAHKFRADTGIEIVHQASSKEELEDTYQNWLRMSPRERKISDRKCRELFGCNNIAHYNKLITEYDEGSQSADKPDDVTFGNE